MNNKTILQKQEFMSDLLGERYSEYLHSSGMKILVFPKKLTTAYAVLSVDFGGEVHAYELTGKRHVIKSGTAHFLEHRMFQTSYSQDVTHIFSALGADVNAYTSTRKTAYLTSGTENFPDVVYELVRFVTDPCFTHESTENEKKIIAEEIKMYEDDSYTACSAGCIKALYGDIGFTSDVCGTLESIKKITEKDLLSVYNAFYTTDNMILAVCGDITDDDVIEAVDRALPPHKYSQRLAVAVKDKIPEKVVKNRVEQKRNVSRPLFGIGVFDPSPCADVYEGLRREAAMMVLVEMLFSRGEPFYNSLYDTGAIAPSVSYGYASYPDKAYAYFFGTADNPDDILAKLCETVEKMKKERPDKESFLRNLRVRYAEEIKDYDSTEDIANALLDSAESRYRLFDIEKILESVTYEQVEKLLDECFRPENYALSAIFPDE